MAKLDPRIYKTLRSIDEALLSLLSERPFSKITIDMLCRSALINRSTFYKYYTDKYSLLDSYLDRALSQFRDTVRADFVRAEPTTVGNQAYTDLFRLTLEYLHDNRDSLQVLWNASITRNLYKEMVEVVRDCIREKTECREGRERYLELYSTFFASNMMTLVEWWFRNEPRVNKEEVLRIMRSDMVHGLFATFKSLT